jgi:DNA-directed RNA polymerase specialized sigma24 family protein
VARRFVCGTSLDREDYRCELIADLAAIHPKYDPQRSAPITWIWMRAQKVRRGMVRGAVRNTAAPLGLPEGVEYEDPALTSPVGSRGHPARAEAIAEVVAILDRMTPHQRKVALSVLRNWTQKEVKSRLGLTLCQREAVLGEIRAAVGAA